MDSTDRTPQQRHSSASSKNVDRSKLNGSQALGVFAAHYEELIERGYSPIPVHTAGTIKEGVDRSKTPCFLRWSEHCIEIISDEKIADIMRYRPDADLALCSGYNGLVQLDVDALDEEIQSGVLEIIGEDVPRRVGNPAKLGVLYLRWTGSGPFPYRKWLDRNGNVLVEIPHQCIASPSLWPGKKDKTTGEVLIPAQPYRMADGSMYPPPVADLPELNDDKLAALNALQEPLGPPRWEGETLPVRETDLTDEEKPIYEKYAQSALEGEAEQLAKVTEGGRNNALNKAAFKLGRYVWHGLLTKEEATKKLLYASRENKLIEDDGEKACLDTINSGLWDTKDHPLPDLGKANGSKNSSKRNGKQPPKGVRLKIIGADEIEPKPVNWTWPDVVPQGKLSLIAGYPSEGKSQITIYMASVITTGTNWHLTDIAAEIGYVVILQAEDGNDDTIVPRLMAAKADRSFVKIVQAVETDDKDHPERGFNLQADLENLGHAIEDLGSVKLIIIDPISAYLGKVDSHNNADVRAVLAPIAAFAERYNVAVLGITHLNKGNNTSKGAGNAMNRITGSNAFVAAARSVWLVTRHPDDETRSRFLPVKNNLARNQGGFGFRVETVFVDGKEYKDIKTSKVVWEQERVYVKADDALDSNDNKKPAERNAELFLVQLLKHGPMNAKEATRIAKEAGISERTLRRARENLELQTETLRDEKGQVIGSQWRLHPLGDVAACH
jgi:hypothetical protein